MGTMKQGATLYIVALCLLLSGCTSFGPTTVERDRFGYTSTIAESWKRQMLLNIVKIRYGDAPIFLEVASIFNQYQTQIVLNAAFGWTFPPAANNQQIGVASSYIDRPTITCNPLTGEKLVRNLTTPAKPATVMSLVEGGLSH